MGHINHQDPLPTMAAHLPSRCPVCGRLIHKDEESLYIGRGLRRHKRHRVVTIVKGYQRILEDQIGETL
jgi:adenine-specific DNA methylase